MELVPASKVSGYVAREIELGRLAAFGLRLRVAVWRGALTRQLAEGADSVESRALALRARQLCTRRTREAIAASIDGLLERAARARPLLSSQVPIDRAKLNAARPELIELAERLRAPQAVRPQGVALALLLLTDPALPLHGEAGPLELGSAIIDVNDRLDAAPVEDPW
jgi:hypothetical protein